MDGLRECGALAAVHSALPDSERLLIANDLRANRLKLLYDQFEGEISYDQLRIAMTCIRNRHGPLGRG